VFGYVSIGAAAEPLPELGVPQGEPPSYAPAEIASGHGQPAAAADPTVGRYVVRNDSADWVNSANSFLSGLQTANFFGSPIPFTNSQYYWAMPFEYVSNKDSFINSVNIALTESHGNWGVFSTRDNQDDLETSRTRLLRAVFEARDAVVLDIGDVGKAGHGVLGLDLGFGEGAEDLVDAGHSLLVLAFALLVHVAEQFQALSERFVAFGKFFEPFVYGHALVCSCRFGS
jgi:hypothetical protein